MPHKVERYSPPSKEARHSNGEDYARNNGNHTNRVSYISERNPCTGTYRECITMERTTTYSPSISRSRSSQSDRPGHQSSSKQKHTSGRSAEKPYLDQKAFQDIHEAKSLMQKHQKKHGRQYEPKEG